MVTNFTASFSLILISELGDKTFFTAAVLAMRHSRALVFAGAFGALALMTALSASIAQIFTLLPRAVIHYGMIALLVYFGLQLLRQARKIPANAAKHEQEEAQALVERAEKEKRGRMTSLAVLMEAFSLTFLAEWGDRTQLATMTLAADNSVWSVIAGGTLGHGVCTAIAVLGGRWLASYISERAIAYVGGTLFLIFAAITLIEGM
ncbi:MAG: TMEM165/GDT1 family protein [Kastovskya adunca ATA6-11-RM4]|jgi:putative Ca2+/H+ antiporter (TMEM165/GDT1 family)|nr:TMEM165/GDT1 family protein [Kastovskya adunca ATA6-11-RM4]